MALALAEARAAAAQGEVPVGAVTLLDGAVVAARHNERERTGDPTAHAELLALRDTAASVGGWRLYRVVLVATLEPCPMCAGALVAARVGRLVFGATDPRAGACGRSTTCVPTPGSTTNCRSPRASGRTSAATAHDLLRRETVIGGRRAGPGATAVDPVGECRKPGGTVVAVTSSFVPTGPPRAAGRAFAPGQSE